MPLCSARILSNDGIVVADTVDVWIDIVPRDHGEEWYGSFDLSRDPQEVLQLTMCHMHLSDGRIGEIMITAISGSDKIHYVFQGMGLAG